MIADAGPADPEPALRLFSDLGELKSGAGDFAKWAEALGAATLAVRNVALSPVSCDSLKSRVLISGELRADVSGAASKLFVCLQLVSGGGGSAWSARRRRRQAAAVAASVLDPAESCPVALTGAAQIADLWA